MLNRLNKNTAIIKYNRLESIYTLKMNKRVITRKIEIALLLIIDLIDKFDM